MSVDLTIYVGDAGEKYSDPDDWRELIVDGRLHPDMVVPYRRNGELGHARVRDIPELAAILRSLQSATPAPAISEAEEIVTSPQPTLLVLDKPTPEQDAPRSATSAEKVATDDVAARPFGRPNAPARRRRTETGLPLRMLAAFAGLIVLAALVGVVQNAGGGQNGAVEQQNAVVTLFVARETRVRSEPTARGTAPIASLSRGDRVRGSWVEGAGGARWLALTEGPYEGAYVWGANLLPDRPPELENVSRGDRIMVSGGPVLSGPRPDANILAQVEPGTSLRVVGRTSSGWLEIERPNGGVGYVDAALLEVGAAPAQGGILAAFPQADANDSAATTDRRVLFVNNTPYTLWELQASDPRVSLSGTDRLGRDGAPAVIGAGRSALVLIDDGDGTCVFDVRAVFKDGDRFSQTTDRRFDVCQEATKVYSAAPPPTELTVPRF